VDDIYGYMAALGKFKRGESTTVRIVRGQETMQFNLTFD
jgi:hypothetical protein